MKDRLIKKLHDYLVSNNPDVLLGLDSEQAVLDFLEGRVNPVQEASRVWIAEGKPPFIVEELCMDHLTAPFRPSKFNYLSSVLVEEFETEYNIWRESGILPYEVFNLIQACWQVFGHFGFNDESEGDRRLLYAVVGTIQEYLTDKQ